MRTLSTGWNLLTCALLLVVSIAVPAQAQTRNPDSGLFTYYYAVDSTELDWVTCGTLPSATDCYGTGQLGPFTNACAIVQSVPAALDAFTVVRYIYVLDSGSEADGASLVAYRRTDTVSEHGDIISVTKEATVPLPSIVAGTAATCLMVQNPTNIYVGTTQSAAAVSINKTTFDVTALGIGNGTLTSMTADSYGFVTVNRNQAGGITNTIYGPDGEPEIFRGFGAFMINPIDGVNPANYPLEIGSLPRIVHQPKGAR